MRLITREQAQELDHLAMTKHDISGESLMGNAGQKIAEFVQSQLINIHNPNIGIVSGKGNNGGDGFAVGEFLNNLGFKITIYSLVEKNNITGDAKIFHDHCGRDKVAIIYDHKPPVTKPDFDLMIDALLGTGFTGPMRDNLFSWVEWINDCKWIVAADIPSGVNANNGYVGEYAVKAQHTVTMGYSKLGMMIEPGKSNSGEVHPVDIGFPNIISDLNGRSWSTITDKEIHDIIKPVHKSTHKHIQGKVLIVAGSKGMTGAAYLATMAALRSGVGLTITCAPSSLNLVYEEKITEGMTISCEDKERGYFTEENYDEIMAWIDWCDVFSIGPGIGQNTGTAKLVKKIVKTIDKPMVIDADGLVPFYNNFDLFNKIKNEFIITPHIGELSNLLGKTAKSIQKDLPKTIDEMMPSFPGILIAKFSPSLVAWETLGAVNSTGNAGLATAGSGDVLTGIVSSFMAQGYHAVEAAKSAVFIHGKASDQLAKSISQRGMISGDLLYKIGRVLQAYES